MKIVLLGATRGMGRALARRFAERGDALFLLGRYPVELAAAAHDLTTRRGALSRVRRRSRPLARATSSWMPNGFTT